MSLAPQRRKPVVLLVEDNSIDARMVQKANEDSDNPCDMMVIDDGVAALAWLRRQDLHVTAPRPDLVLLDLNLPGIHGLELLEEMKGDERLADIPVVVLSTSDLEADIAATYRLKGAAYVKKPTGIQGFNEVFDTIKRFWLETVSLPPLSSP